MTIVLLLVSSIAGFVTHGTRKYTDQLTRGWREIANYAAGVVCVFPFALIFYRGQPHDNRDDSNRFTVAYILAFVSFGAGVVFGWLLDTIGD